MIEGLRCEMVEGTRVGDDRRDSGVRWWRGLRCEMIEGTQV